MSYKYICVFSKDGIISQGNMDRDTREAFKIAVELHNRDFPEDPRVMYDGEDPEKVKFENGAIVSKTIDELYAEDLITPADFKAAKNATVLAELSRIDRDSIRSIREYIAAKGDAPQFVKDHESAAAVKRAELLK